MRLLREYFDSNRRWAESMCNEDPEFFNRLVRQQKPDVLWIGCSDSRVPANQISGMLPGSIFVHRNVANVVPHHDLNCMAVLQYAVEVLRVKHVLVVGHDHCGGVGAVLTGQQRGLVGEWLQPVERIFRRHIEELAQYTEGVQWDLLGELNVINQAHAVATSEIVEQAWLRQQPLAVHGWVYNVANGLLRDLGVTMMAPEECIPALQTASRGVFERASGVMDNEAVAAADEKRASAV